MGRVELLRANRISYAQLEMSGVLFVIVKVECKYKSPARYDDELTLFTKVKKTTHVRIDHEYQLKRGETLIAEAATTIACVNRQGELMQIPPDLF
jgi:acyl-CoA thioester hydrolase